MNATRAALVLLLSLGVALAQNGAPTPTATPGGLRPARLHVIASSRMFTTVNRNDAMAAVKSWLILVGKEKGFALDSKVDIVSNLAEMRRRLETRSVDVLILDCVDYLQLETTGLVVPGLVGNRSLGQKPRYSYILLVGPSSPAQSLSDLRGKSLQYFSRSESNTGLAWLEVSMAREKLGRASSFFAAAKQAPKPQACVLPLFFGAVDACIVDEINFDLLKEMNPQLGKLRVLARSAPLIESVIATPTQAHSYREEFLDAILGLDATPGGSQILMVFKTGRLVPIAPGDLDAARALWTEYRKLTGALPGASAEQAQSPPPRPLALPRP